jgi:hypothetical protein
MSTDSTPVKAMSATGYWRRDSTTCDPHNRAHQWTIENEGIPYLRSRGDCVVTGGNGHCSRVSCSWDSAIYLCIDEVRENLIFDPL